MSVGLGVDPPALSQSSYVSHQKGIFSSSSTFLNLTISDFMPVTSFPLLAVYLFSLFFIVPSTFFPKTLSELKLYFSSGSLVLASIPQAREVALEATAYLL